MFCMRCPLLTIPQYSAILKITSPAPSSPSFPDHQSHKPFLSANSNTHTETNSSISRPFGRPSTGIPRKQKTKEKEVKKTKVQFFWLPEYQRRRQNGKNRCSSQSPAFQAGNFCRPDEWNRVCRETGAKAGNAAPDPESGGNPV